jgi:hypothetical protein
VSIDASVDATHQPKRPVCAETSEKGIVTRAVTAPTAKALVESPGLLEDRVRVELDGGDPVRDGEAAHTRPIGPLVNQV